MSLQFAREDYKSIVGAGEFSVLCTFTSLGATPLTAVVSGIYSEHHNSINTDGLPVNSKNVRLTVVESDLIAKGYPTRNTGSNQIKLFNHKVSFADIGGTTRNYVVKEIFPDFTVGGITLILGDYSAS